MPLTVNVGLSRKSSQNYQSAGVSINLTAELDQALLADPPRLQQEIDRIYGQAADALDRQAGVAEGDGTARTARTARTAESGFSPANGAARRPTQNGNGNGGNGAAHGHHANGHQQPNGATRSNGHATNGHANAGNGDGAAYGGPMRPATDSQVRALRSIAKRLRCDLDQEAHDEFGIPLDQLDVRQASHIIDLLKERQESVPAGRGRVRP